MMPDISLADFIEELASGDAIPEVTLQGLSGRLRPQAHWRVRETSLTTQLFYLVSEGEIRGEANGEGFTAGAGDLIWVDFGSRLTATAAPGTTPVIYRFRLRLRRARGELVHAPRPHRVFSPARGAEPWMARIVDEAAAPGALAGARSKGLLLCFFTELARCEEPAKIAPRELSRAQRQTLHAYFLEELKRRPTPADLAAQVDLSPDYFTRCFKVSYGVPPRRWMLEERIRLSALRLIESNLTVSQVATEFGYPDVFSFSRQFKTVLGHNPSDYRKHRGYNAAETLPKP